MTNNEAFKNLIIGFNLVKSMKSTLTSPPVTVGKVLSASKNYSSGVMMSRRTMKALPEYMYSNWSLGIEQTMEMDSLVGMITANYKDRDEETIVPNELVVGFKDYTENLYRSIAVTIANLVDEDKELLAEATEVQKSIVAECYKINNEVEAEMRQILLQRNAEDDFDLTGEEGLRQADIEAAKIRAEKYNEEDGDDDISFGKKSDGMRVISEDPHARD